MGKKYKYFILGPKGRRIKIAGNLVKQFQEERPCGIPGCEINVVNSLYSFPQEMLLLGQQYPRFSFTLQRVEVKTPHRKGPRKKRMRIFGKQKK